MDWTVNENIYLSDKTLYFLLLIYDKLLFILKLQEALNIIKPKFTYYSNFTAFNNFLKNHNGTNRTYYPEIVYY